MVIKLLPVYTPWGMADNAERLAEGITSYSTPSHGGIRLSWERQKQLPAGVKNFLQNIEWWEEDCDWCVPYIVFQDDIRKQGIAYKFEENLATAYATAKTYHPEILSK
jgi:transposase-like protein